MQRTKPVVRVRQPVRLGRDEAPRAEELASPPQLHIHHCTYATFWCSTFGERCSGVPVAHYEALHIGPNMDNWGDPWADNAKSPTKDAVTSPLPPTFAPAPALLNGFLDDAGWGNEDESFGDWLTAPAIEEGYAPPTKAALTESFTAEHVITPSNDNAWGIARESEQHVTHKPTNVLKKTRRMPQRNYKLTTNRLHGLRHHLPKPVITTFRQNHLELHMRRNAAS
jgi:hypothetical protein